MTIQAHNQEGHFSLSEFISFAACRLIQVPAHCNNGLQGALSATNRVYVKHNTIHLKLLGVTG